jgi:hypothetical protein
MTPDLLAFAGIDSVEVPAAPLERHIAEVKSQDVV